MSGTERAFIGLFAIVAAAAVFVVGTWPRAGGELAVFAAPWSVEADAYRIVSRSGGDLVAGTSLSWAVVARSEDAEFVSKLYMNGALYVSNATLAAWCGFTGGDQGRSAGTSQL